MERESFEDEEVAQFLNDNYISVKVDREERPDVDSIYMTFCQGLTGHGGWPLTIIMTPDKKPFFAGTYFPKNSRRGMPGLIDILEKIITLWKTDKNSLIESSEEIVHKIKSGFLINMAGDLSKAEVEKTYNSLLANFDSIYGGFGSAPKFPTPHNLMFLLRYYKEYQSKQALDMVEKTLESMFRGGIYDHIGHGFSRYSTDRKWLVPHFEKMLYDNALIAIIYLEAYQVTGKNIYAHIAQEIFSYILRDMTSQAGGFYSAEDADSEGEEGKFYVWTPEEIKEILGERDSQVFCDYYNITFQGNFEGKNIPNLINTELNNVDASKLKEMKKQIFNQREKRTHPYKDDKILTAWNGLMIAALSLGARVLDNKEYAQKAKKAFQFILDNLYKDNRLYARYRDGETKYLAYVDDYAFLIWGLIELYEATYEVEFLKEALKLNREMLEYFWDENEGGLYLYGRDSEKLIARPKEIYDGSIPSGNSVATLNFLRLARLTGDTDLEEKAARQFKVFGGTVQEQPLGHTFFLSAFLFNLATNKEIVIIEPGEVVKSKEFINIFNRSYQPFAVSVLFNPDSKERLVELVPFIKDYNAQNNKTTVYLCENFACHSPITDSNKFAEML